MNNVQKRLRDCFSESIRERGRELHSYRAAVPYDEFLDAVSAQESEDPRAIAALGLAVLCNGTSSNIDAIAILATIQFLEETLGVEKGLDDNRTQRITALVDLIPGTQEEFKQWIDDWHSKA